MDVSSAIDKISSWDEAVSLGCEIVSIESDWHYHLGDLARKVVGIETIDVETQEQKAREIARWFGVPPSKLGIADGSTYNSKSEDGAGYLTHCLRRWLRKIQHQCWLRLLTTSDQKNIEYRHDTDELLRMDQLSRYQAYQIGIQSRILNPNEVRAELNMLPYEGGDEYGVTAATMPVEPVEEPADDEEPEDESDTEDDSEPMDTPADTEQNSTDQHTIARRRALFSLTYRARRKADNPNAFLTWLDSGWKNERVEWTEIGAGSPEPEFFEAMHTQLQQVASTATADQLSAFVETVASNFEKEA
jgi:hypothetical protein